MITGCNGASSSVTFTALPSVQPVTPTQLPVTPVPSPTSSATPSASPAPSLTPTLRATETPLPALQIADAQQRAEELLKTNANCTLPCWWGIVPGKTPWTVAQSILYQFDQEIYDRTAGRSQPFIGEAIIPVKSEISSLGRLYHKYTVADGLVQLVDVFPGRVPTYGLSEIFKEYGKPAEVWVRTDPDAPSGAINFLAVTYYPKLGIIASYDQEARRNGQLIMACLPPAFASDLILWAPTGTDDFRSVVNRTGLTDEGLKYMPLQDATQVSIDTFFEKLSEPDAQLCVETPADLWR
jgi:hypothetical protein